MPVEIKRKSNESTYSLLRRFADKVKKGRVLTLAKKNMHYEKPKNKRQLKVNAMRRLYNRQRRDYLIKIGEISEEVEGMRQGQGQQNNRFRRR